MDISALLTSAGINIGVCVVLLSLYSVLRKQPSNVGVYFGRRLVSVCSRPSDPFSFERFVPSPSWIVKAWETTEEEILATGGMDAAVFLRMVVFSIRIFSVAVVICFFLILPVNYHGQEMRHKRIPLESLEVFTIANVKEGSKWLWTHCLALYIITCSACILLYFEYKSIAKMRLKHITGAPPNPSHFTVLVRSIPRCSHETYSETVNKFFTKYHSSSYLSHQMVYRSGRVQKLMTNAEKMYMTFKAAAHEQNCQPSFMPRGLCGGPTKSFEIVSRETDNISGKTGFGDLDLATIRKECAAAVIFFKTRYAAVTTAEVLQSSNPMLWVSVLAPEPHDVYWSNLCIPYRQLWIRKIGTLVASIAFVLVFLIPVTFVQGLTQLDQLQQTFPFLRGLLKKKFMNQVVTGYLPSVILILALYTVPPTMMVFSAVEGSISRSGRKRSACCKVLYFTIWNVFFVNIFTGSVISQLSFFSSVKDIPAQLAKAVPRQASFFMTYVLTSGWASLSCEVMQFLALFCNLVKRFVLRIKDDSSNCTFSFPYHTEVPRVLLFGFLGFTCSILAPLMLPFLLIYFSLAYLVYKNQILNVYVPKYESEGQYWPIAHNTTIFSLVLSQIIALGVFGIKRSPVASGFTIPLIICTLLFHEYCRQRFLPIFKVVPAEVFIEMDQKDEQCGRMEEIYQKLHSAYRQFTETPHELCRSECLNHHDDGKSISDPEKLNPGLIHPMLGRLPLPGIKEIIGWLSLLLFSGKEADQLNGSSSCNLDIAETSKK
ncbi:CSC1-like protein RXW8 isoform X1 [Juglans regia]|uniref:CSC1-like protein RXW8 isoform X1 n=3 Tax=Juglans regia TaxID=51240 RepID=A0A6P9F2L0_JUGRE|nr:CSC1-like protein RXW8 isoform X1 [Juglans regia]XP_035548987.1 CSC1-like protein RXW8 isoform X1 [Juglans regia]XP_035548988.1 CSC1-like protein RXW8 isoform X1 [Juglans regia]XP_035548989.1 CSC1-like protein RXW8 isoform X1 [Juglans regia]